MESLSDLNEVLRLERGPPIARIKDEDLCREMEGSRASWSWLARTFSFSLLFSSFHATVNCQVGVYVSCQLYPHMYK